MGVRRAVDLAERESADLWSGSAGSSRIYTMGPLIHNPQVLASLKERGVAILDEEELPEDLAGSVVIIRAHGVSPELEERLISRGARIADATCPRVKASQIKARALSDAGYTIFLAGERRHGEIIGIQGFARGCIIVGNPGEAEQAAAELSRKNPGAKTALIGQTTISPDEYRAIGEGIRGLFPGLEVIDTICGATRDRQDSLRKLCAQAEAVIVAGGRDSANTRRLLAIAAQNKPAWLVEKSGEIPEEIRAYRTVGLCAGASTPDALIDAIEEALLSP
ncbi:4-hydroxy-3-methylbut-2-enyl diphosphate reductase [Spirochaetia bacterium]|nr:4-hydroxy-3-methylbut-2-enyl diphosphate reductase [Spirochaetia bacterium]